MASVLGVHGIGNEYGGEATMFADWFPAMRDGISRSGCTFHREDLACAFYGDLFRSPAQMLSNDPPWYSPEDVVDEIESGLLEAWWYEAACCDVSVAEPGSRTLARTPRSVQQALNALSGSKFFAGIAERFMIFSLKQVQRYFTDDDLRQKVIDRVARAIAPDTRVIVGHSLGSVVAYEALCANPDWQVRALVTLGSPLGVKNLIFDRLRPPADESGLGCWPGSVSAWINIVDDGDIVALSKDLRPLFGERVTGTFVHCGSRAHDVRRYLTAEASGEAILAGLRHG